MLEAISAKGWSVAKVAREAGVKYDVVRDLKRRDGSSTSAENAERIASALGFPLGEIQEDLPSFSAPTSHTSDTSTIPINGYDIEASAGPGALVHAEEYVSFTLAFPPEYLERLTRSHPKNLAIIGIKGDSMSPTLKDDDLVMLDSSKTNLSYDGMFVLRFGEALHVKRIARSPSKGFITIISDNQYHPPQEWPADDVEVVGKVIWTGGKV